MCGVGRELFGPTGWEGTPPRDSMEELVRMGIRADPEYRAALGMEANQEKCYENEAKNGENGPKNKKLQNKLVPARSITFFLSLYSFVELVTALPHT